MGAIGSNLLYQLAQTMATNDGRSAAAALRRLAQVGYTSLDEVEAASDWILLSIPGFGVGRLAAVRRLTQPDWQSPSPQAVMAADRFLSAIRFALRFWPPEILASVIQGTIPATIPEPVHESRLALEIFSKAAIRALVHCTASELAQLLWQSRNGHHRPGPDSSSQTRTHVESRRRKPCEAAASNLPAVSLPNNGSGRETNHFAYPRQERWEIVKHFRAARGRGQVQNKEQWAQANYNISSKTLLNYEREFEELG